MTIKTVKCLLPFSNIQFGTYGFVRTCCPKWTKIGPIGSLYTAKDMMSIWNSCRVQKIRKAILEGDLEKVCNVDFCPYAVANKEIDLDALQQKTDDPNLKRVVEQIRQGKTEMETGPVYVDLADSGDCNLRCRMCRGNDAFYKKNPRLSEKLFNVFLPTILPTASQITLTGNGDPFFRKETREYLQAGSSANYHGLKVFIISNANLLTERMWETVRHNNFAQINVSVDGASKATYEYVRKGGRWETLVKNLEMVSRLRKEGAIPRFQLNYLVLESNYREVAAFAKWAVELGADSVVFQKVGGLLHVRENIYFTKDMDALKTIGTMLGDPIFQDRRFDIHEIEFCRQYKDHQVTAGDRLRTRLRILLFSGPASAFYAVRYRFAPVYLFFFRLLQRIGVV